jgi:hypothetical protein
LLDELGIEAMMAVLERASGPSRRPRRMLELR